MFRKEKTVMSEIFNNFENILILYGPTVLLYITQLVDWFITLKKFKYLNIQNQVRPLLNEVREANNKIKILERDVRTFTEEKYNLSVQINELKANIKGQGEMISELKEYLKALSQENIELKAELRRKADEE